jgi:hypothetical protein
MHVVIARQSNKTVHALYRVQSTPLHEGLRQLGVASTLAVLDGAGRDIAPPTHLVVHYFDKTAIAAAAEIRKATQAKLVCFCSDLYDLTPIRALSSVVDIFLAPTPLHHDVIRSAVMKPVCMLPDSLDPIALPPDASILPAAANNTVCWFGYPESFAKSMRFVLPDALKASGFPAARFGLITAPGVQLIDGVRHKSFVPETFYADTAEFSHSLLSHFPQDLHINTFIKCPNKMMTSIVRGLVPIASATPAYQDLAKTYQLEDLLFTGAADLSRRLMSLDAETERKKYGLAAVGAAIAKYYSPEAMARRFLEIMA